jgi:serine/threonine-protein kinase
MYSETARAAPMSNPAPHSQQRFGRFELLNLIGKGGMAEVYKARILQGSRAGEIVALKRLLPELASDAECVDLFTGEADISRLLKHPNIVEVIEVGEVSDIYYLAMEYVEGRDLSAVLARCREKHFLLHVDFAIYMARALLDALDFVHAAKGPNGKALNVVHCDVSPSNVFLSKLGEVKLGDFGIAKVRAIDKWDDGDLVWGKLSYLSPEQLSGQVFDRRADLWSAGTLIYEMLTNRKPFVGKTADELKAAIKTGRPHSIASARASVSEGLERAILKSLEKDPRNRYQTAAEFADALSPFYQSEIGTPLGIASVVRNLFGVR